MNLGDIGQRVRERRESIGLSQARLARLAGLSRATINQIETGTLKDLGIVKLAHLLSLLGLELEAHSRAGAGHGLRMASRSASVSYRDVMAPAALADALASGELPSEWVPHVSTFIDEAPLSLVVSTVEETARLRSVPPRLIWQHLTRWARELKSPRHVWG